MFSRMSEIRHSPHRFEIPHSGIMVVRVRRLENNDHINTVENTEQTKLYQDQKAACKEFSEKLAGISNEEQDAALWVLLEYLQGCEFYTAKGLKFTYQIKGGELFVNRKSKSITKATVMMAFRKCLELKGVVTGPKKLGTFGASYLYPVFMRIGIIREL